MSTKRKGSPAPPKPGESLTLVDEMLASPTEPMPAADAATRVAVARLHLERLQTMPSPGVMDWRVCAMVGNVIEVMIEFDLAQDPDGLLQDAQAALLEASERALTKGAPLRFTGRGLTAVTWLVDAFEALLAEAPHRTMVRVFRETDKRMRALSQGRRRPGDYIAKNRSAS